MTNLGKKCVFEQPEWDKDDIVGADMHFGVADCADDVVGGPTETQVTVWFEQQDANTRRVIYADADVLCVPIDSDVAAMAREIAHETVDGDTTYYDALHRQLNEQVLNCRGMVDGECGALGCAAVTNAIRIIMDDTV